MKKLGFYIGHENHLPHAELLYHSIVENTQLMEKCEIYAVTPEHLELTASLTGVKQLKVSIEPKYRVIPYLGKMFAAAEFEKICDDKYIWIDVDSYFFKNLEYRESTEIYVNPVDVKNIGDNFGEERSDLWTILYQYFKLENTFPFVATRVTKERIFPYYNVSMVLVNNNKDLFQTVKAAVFDLFSLDSIQNIIQSSELHRINIHQAIFTCVILKLYNQHIKPLPYGTNYSFRYHTKTPTPIPYGEIVNIKYDNAFEKNGIPNIWSEIFEPVKEKIKTTWYY